MERLRDRRAKIAIPDSILIIKV